MTRPSRQSLTPFLSSLVIGAMLVGSLGLVPAVGRAQSPVAQEVRVAAGADDAEQTSQGYFSTTSSDLELVVAGAPQTVGIRFNGLSIPRGAAVTSAYIQFQVDETSSGPAALSIHGEAADSAVAYSSGADVLSRVPTSASVAWSPADWPTVGERGAAQRTPDLAPILQEIVDRSGWDIGHSLAVLITGSGVRVAESYNGDANGAPLLHLEYTLSQQQAPIVDAGPDQSIVLPADAILDGTVSDDGLPDPPGALTLSWSRVSGPGVVTFSDPSVPDPTASFSLPGSYLLELRASDGERIGADQLRITVASSSSAPFVDSFTPASAQAASVVSISGSRFSDAEDVWFGGVPASFWIESDGLIHATVPADASTAPIVVGSPAGSGTSASDFVVAPSPLVLVGAGDISDCSGYAEETASLIDAIPGTVFTAGDHAYNDGTQAEFDDCYDPTWGRHRARTRPSPGPVDYDTPNASVYYAYFGAAAGRPDEGYYSYDLGDWHIIALNSECGEVGGCDRSSPQGQWLQEDLLRNPATCTLAYWASPRFNSGDRHGNTTAVSDFWQILYEAGADVVLNGHEHIYERFAPQSWDGSADPTGIREFIVGTGGRTLYTVTDAQPNSEVHDDQTHGVLKLTLHPTGYDWQFIPIPGRSFSDSGSDDCVVADQPPLVDAGPDLVVSWPGSAGLAGEVIDDGPLSQLVITWSQVSGPGTASFADDSSPLTTVSFSAPGTYQLRLSADDGNGPVSDEVSVVVVEDGTQVVEVAVRVGASSDDAEQSVADGSMYLDSSDLELVDDLSYVGASQIVGVRFAGLDIPRNSTIQTASVQFQVDEASPDAAAITIRGEASDDSATFRSTSGDVSDRSPTGASIAWAPPPWPTVGAAGNDQQTPDLSAVVQEIVDRPGWSSGNALTLVFEGSGRRTAESYDGDSAGAPLLRIQYATPTNETRIDVPDVVGLSQGAAEATIAAAGLSVGNVTSQGSATVPAGVVLSQDPSDCLTCAFGGDPVDLVISAGWTPIDVPDLVGQTQANAQATLEAVGLAVGSVTSQSSETVPAGVVLSQDPSDCLACAFPGDPVDLVVSSGPAPIDVPNVVGQSQSSAESTLVAAGLTPGNVASQSSETVPAGAVLSQDPSSCLACALPGDPVDLVVSSGPPNAAPVVDITAPADGATGSSTDVWTFTGSATDDEDGDLAASLVWTSSKDGVLGTGSSVAATLSTGRHTIRAAVTDSRGTTVSASISVHVRKGK